MPDTAAPYLRNDTGIARAIEQAKGLLGERLSTSQAVRDQHARGEDYFTPAPPDAVAFVQSTEEVAAIVKICAEHKVPVIAWGTGTSLEGHVSALHGGITIDLSGMDQILEVHGEDFDCRVQAGVTRKQLNEHIRDTGLMFPVDPGANASLGGMAATSASGTNAVRYGTIKENVLGLTVVTPEGKIIKTGGRSRKTSAGYDLTHLYVGSEGTLGIITEVQLRLYGIPEAMAAAVCQFDDLQSAVDTVVGVLQYGIPVARMELLDDVQIRACIAYSKLDELEPKQTLFFEFHGSDTGVKEQAETVQAIAEEYGGSRFSWATREEERNRLWEARHNVFYACLAMAPGKRGWATDVVVPISRLTECILETKEDIEAGGLVAPIAGHVGDGNFHCCIMLDPDDPEDKQRAHDFNKRLVDRALAMGGTCTGEHGVGVGKIGSLMKEAGEAYEYMRRIKQALDPNNIMNPGKVVAL
ncbi:MAG TPA: FAD-linked oxidase C-terminal domain-containing protein [Alphaproteobacteria bacterium]|nr:FAD-linked oxidase C-terminal domain-containing protein [Alphaproteobacteria bacterium]